VPHNPHAAQSGRSGPAADKGSATMPPFGRLTGGFFDFNIGPTQKYSQNFFFRHDSHMLFV